MRRSSSLSQTATGLRAYGCMKHRLKSTVDVRSPKLSSPTLISRPTSSLLESKGQFGDTKLASRGFFCVSFQDWDLLFWLYCSLIPRLRKLSVILGEISAMVLSCARYLQLATTHPPTSQGACMPENHRQKPPSLPSATLLAKDHCESRSCCVVLRQRRISRKL